MVGGLVRGGRVLIGGRRRRCWKGLKKGRGWGSRLITIYTELGWERFSLAGSRGYFYLNVALGKIIG